MSHRLPMRTSETLSSTTITEKMNELGKARNYQLHTLQAHKTKYAYSKRQYRNVI